MGTGSVGPRYRKYRSFKEARAFVHTLNLKRQIDWKNYCNSGKKPKDIPLNASSTYKKDGWKTWGDWLGSESKANRDKLFRPFEEARFYIHSLGLKGRSDWLNYCKSGNKPDDIPTNPGKTYKNKGWISYGDWFGTGSIASQQMIYLSFKLARKFVHALNIKSQKEWYDYAKSGKKPSDIPAIPAQTYKNKGWESWGDWLGTGTIAPQKIKFLPFSTARSYVHKLNLKTSLEWRNYCKSENKPINIPAYPNVKYKKNGWISWEDWLGIKEIIPKNQQFLPFNDARSFVRSLNLKKQLDWKNYCKNGDKPKDIPTHPEKTYINKGWISWPDWFGSNENLS